MTEDEKIWFLCKTIQHIGLDIAIKGMKTKIATEPTGPVFYITYANCISAVVSELPHSLAHNRGSSGVNEVGMNLHFATIYHTKGIINTGHHGD